MEDNYHLKHEHELWAKKINYQYLKGDFLPTRRKHYRHVAAKLKLAKPFVLAKHYVIYRDPNTDRLFEVIGQRGIRDVELGDEVQLKDLPHHLVFV